MKKEIRTVVYDDKLHLEAYRFEGIVQPLRYFGIAICGAKKKINQI